MAFQRRGGNRRRRKVDFIAANHIDYIDYKDIDLLKRLFQNVERFFHVVLLEPALRTNVL
jgi:ribosomal protein S18